MQHIIERLFILVAMVTGCSCLLYRYTLDTPNVCQSTGVVTQWIEDDDEIIIYGKVGNDGRGTFKECIVKFGPSTKATKLSSMIQFETYYNYNCGIYLAMQQSPYAFFDQDVSTVFNFSCRNTPGKSKFYTDANNNIKLILHKQDAQFLNYNFILNITLTDHEVTTGVSTAIIIGIGVLIGIAIPGIGCVVYRYLKIKRWSKRQYEQENQPAQSLHRLTGGHAHSTPPSIRYSNMPVVEGDLTGSIHSQTCVIGSQGPDGRCTVCNISHEDFAHVVDVDNMGHIQVVDRNNQRSREDIAHHVEINNTASNSPRSRSGRPGQTGPHRNDHSASNAALRIVSPPGSNLMSQAPAHSGGALQGNQWLNDDYDDDDDIDVSGNDLIPPSYDLSPPSYDEAVSMPKPSTDVVMPTRHREDLETDPLYQNLETLTSDVR